MKKPLSALADRTITRVEQSDPIRVLLLGYLSYVLIGWAALCLPWSRTSSDLNPIDHLFTAVSAVSTTGLATISTADAYTRFGEGVVLALIQLGGLGYMTMSSVVLLTVTGRLSPLRERVCLAAMALPENFKIGSFLRLVVIYTLVIEAAGALLLYTYVFAPRGEAEAVWLSVFHSISSFCTAGFGLYNDSFERYRGDIPLNAIIITLSYLGALGFLIVQDIWHSVRTLSVRISFTSKIIVVGTACVALVGTLLFASEEPLVQGLPLDQRMLQSFFQVMSASTTVGFNTLPVGALSGASVILLVVVMLIGASPAGTGGGIKITAISAIWAVMVSTVRRRQQVTLLGRAIPTQRLRAAVAATVFYCLTLAAGTYLLALTETAPLGDIGFECASALGTVGLSRGLTGSLSDWGKLIVIALMFVGRAGPIALALAVLSPKERLDDNCREEDVVI